MIRNLTYDNIKDLENNIDELKVKKNKLILGHGEIELPSELYPLPSKKVDVFYYNNTQDIEDMDDFKLLLECYNAVEFKVGRCYTNIEDLLKVAKEKGLKGKLKPYIGWLMVGDGSNLVHHCWAVYENKYMLDFSASKLDFYVLQSHMNTGLELDEIREKLANNFLDNKDRPNSDLYTIGRVIPIYVYVGCECEPKKGLLDFVELMDKHPNHPNYTNVDNSGASKLQRMILDKLK